MFDPDAVSLVFPELAVELIRDRVLMIDPDPTQPITVVRRPLRTSDPVQCIGVFGATWTPDVTSHEMRGHNEPTLGVYTIAVQVKVEDMDEERGLKLHSTMSKHVRAMLYRDAVLRVGLAALSVTMSGSTERAKRWGVRTQRYLSNELEGSFLHLSTLEFWLETETV